MKKMTNFLNGFVNVLFNPLSPIITLLIGWFLSLLVVPNGNVEFYCFVNFFIDNKYTLIIIIICWLLSSIMYTHEEIIIKNQENKISNLEGIREEQDEQKKQLQTMLIQKYGDLYNTSKKIRFKEVLKSFVLNNSEIISAQIYRYTIKCDKNELKVKVTFEEGYASEGIELNSMLQSYFTFNKDEYYEFKNLLNSWNELENYKNKNLNIETLESSLMDKFFEMFKLIYSELIALKDISNIQNIHYSKYQILTMILKLLLDNQAFEILNLKNWNNIFTKLQTGKRTGILGSILSENIYIFKHNDTNEKSGRFYFTFNFNAYNDNYIVLYALSPSESTTNIESISNINDNWNNNLQILAQDFIKRFEYTSLK